MAYNSSQQELEELRATALEACQGVEEGEVQAGSSVASRLRALSRHVTQCVHRALHLGVQKALGVVSSHYQVDLEAISMGYVVPVGIDDEVAMNRADVLAAPAIASSPRTSWTSSSRMLPQRVALKPENRWACCALYVFVLVFGPSGHVINIFYLKHLDACKSKRLLFVSAIALFCLSHFLG
jgi:hypothetical protein